MHTFKVLVLFTFLKLDLILGKSFLLSQFLLNQLKCWGKYFDKVYYCAPSISNSSQKDRRFFDNLQKNVPNFHLLDRLITKNDLNCIWVLSQRVCIVIDGKV